MREFRKKRKAYTDKMRLAQVKGDNSVSKSAVLYTGSQHDQLRPMTNVEANRLMEGHTFKLKDLLYLRIAEEANLLGISTKAS